MNNSTLLAIISLFFLLTSFAQAGVITEEITLYAADSTSLSGVLEIPEGKEKVPVILIIAGSGATDRDGNSRPMMVHNAYKKLGASLNENGYASLRYDKRTAGNSKFGAKFDPLKMTFDTFVEDAIVWIDALQKDKRFSDIILLGHSQGSLIAMLAAQKRPVNAVVSLAGAGQSIDKVLMDQLGGQLPPDAVKECETHFANMKAGKPLDEISPMLKMTGLFIDQNRLFLASWMKYNPVEELKKLESPILIVNGTTDIQVPISEADLLVASKSGTEKLIIEKMNHCLVDAPSDRMENIKTYNQPELTLSDGLIVGVLKFVEKTLSK